MTKGQPVRARSAWRPADFPNPDAFSFTLSERHFAAFDAALAANRRAGRNVEDLTARDFALEAIADDVAAWRDEVLRGRGFIVLREFPRDRYTADDLGMLFFGLGTYFGRAVSQSSMGDRLGHVVDVGGKDRRERAYRNSRELTLHADRADVVGMLCLQPPPGESAATPAPTPSTTRSWPHARRCSSRSSVAFPITAGARNYPASRRSRRSKSQCSRTARAS